MSEHWHLCERVEKVVCHVRRFMHKKVDTTKLDQPMFPLKSCFQRSLRLWKTSSLATVYYVRASITTVETNGRFDTRLLLLSIKRCVYTTTFLNISKLDLGVDCARDCTWQIQDLQHSSLFWFNLREYFCSYWALIKIIHGISVFIDCQRCHGSDP